MPEPALASLALVMALGLAFNFMNGFNDAANTVATTIGARALTLPAALALAAFFNFLGAFASHKVAYTVATGVLDPGYINSGLINAALAASIVWSLATWSMGIPSSSSHALISALAGAGLAKAANETGALDAFNPASLGGVIMGLFTSPFLGFLAGFMLFKLFTRLVSLFSGMTLLRANRRFARLQVFSAAAMSFSHGANDAQKTMGLMALALFQGGVIEAFVIPWWITFLSAAAISAGTLWGGVRIIKTVAKRITELQPVHGFSAEAGGAMVVLGASAMGMPVSTTHVVISSVVGVGFSKSVYRTPRDTLLAIINTWLLTIPSVMALSAGFYFIFVS